MLLFAKRRGPLFLRRLFSRAYGQNRHNVRITGTNRRSTSGRIEGDKPKSKEDNMITTKKLNMVALAALSLGIAGLCSAQTSPSSKTSPTTASSATTTNTGSTAPYTEGSVWEITMVRTKAGMSDDYLKNLAQAYKSTNDEAKKQGIIMDYKILLGDAAKADDFDILLMVQYKNMAALDGLREKTDPIAAKLIGGEDQLRQGSIKRMEIRDILGTKTMREVTLK
jgi:hypothetical protein